VKIQFINEGISSFKLKTEPKSKRQITGNRRVIQDHSHSSQLLIADKPSNILFPQLRFKQIIVDGVKGLSSLPEDIRNVSFVASLN
jgi:hypothetical protein